MAAYVAAVLSSCWLLVSAGHRIGLRLLLLAMTTANATARHDCHW
jgi:hypothetical protein